MRYFIGLTVFILLLFSFGNCKPNITTPDEGTLAVTSPTDGEVIYGDVAITVKVYDSNISKVILFIDSTDKSEKSSSPYNFTFDFSPYDGKTVTLVCSGYDSNGSKIGESNKISLVVSSSGNVNPDPQ